MGALALITVPLTVFLLFVAPLWLWLYYHQRRTLSQWRPDDIQRLQQLTADAQRMRDRIAALEEILDAEHPDWRQSR